MKDPEQFFNSICEGIHSFREEGEAETTDTEYEWGESFPDGISTRTRITHIKENKVLLETSTYKDNRLISFSSGEGKVRLAIIKTPKRIGGRESYFIEIIPMDSDYWEMGVEIIKVRINKKGENMIYNEKQAAEKMNIAVARLEALRRTKTGPTFIGQEDNPLYHINDIKEFCRDKNIEISPNA